ncbi:hypothetical protein MMC10_000748 [Thelotrema lepadinum]|nr:hypothetical protein [Thelotrema lepadinum]
MEQLYVNVPDFPGPPLRIMVISPEQACSVQSIINIDREGEVLISLRNEDKNNRFEKFRVAAEKVSGASEVFQSLIQDAYEKSAGCFQPSKEEPVHVRLTEAYCGEIILLLFLMHHGLDDCIALKFSDDAASGKAVIHQDGLECTATWDTHALMSFSDKYRCRHLMSDLCEKNISMNMPAANITGMGGLNLFAEASLNHLNGPRFLEITAQMLSVEDITELDGVANACLLPLLKSKKLELLEMRKKVTEAQRECLGELTKSAHIKYKFQDEDFPPDGYCDGEFRTKTLLKIFEEADRIASSYEKSLDKMTGCRNIFQKALDEASAKHTHICEGLWLDCPINWALDLLSMHECFWPESPKGISIREFVIQNGEHGRSTLLTAAAAADSAQQQLGGHLGSLTLN